MKADVLKLETPIDVRRLIAGEEQYRQQNVTRGKLLEFLRFLQVGATGAAGRAGAHQC